MSSRATFGGLVLTGPCAGQFHRCEQPYLRLMDPVVPSVTMNYDPREAYAKVRNYRWLPIEIMSARHTGLHDLETGVWTPDDWTLADAIRELMEGYKRP